MDRIVIKGAREHNLKDINLELPRNKLVVITGLSGSGKSSLAFDTVYAEGQRRYVESLSAYARQFLEQVGKPDVDSIEGLSPAISIEQKTARKNPRSIFPHTRRENSSSTSNSPLDTSTRLPETSSTPILSERPTTSMGPWVCCARITGLAR